MKIVLVIFWFSFLWTETSSLTGVYEYQSSEESENQYIVLDKVDGQIKGKYFGTEDGKGHGVFFYENTMEKLTIDENGNIEFEIGDRFLFEENQFKKHKKNPDMSPGRSSRTLKYKGRITGDKIELTCDSDFYDCWDTKFVFSRISNAR
jgi:hypothetical protein